jgi:hypothetical protein
MSIITVTTTAGTHHKWRNHNVKGEEANTDPICWTIVGIIGVIILIRGLIKTFKQQEQ